MLLALGKGTSLVSFDGQAVNLVDVQGGNLIAAGGNKVLDALQRAGFYIGPFSKLVIKSVSLYYP
jgi:hypothetical protein